MFPPELYAAVKRIEASAAPLLRSSAERIVILDTHVVLECTLWRDESESDSPLGCALKAGRIVPAASHETLLELAGVAARPVKQMLEAEAAARALTMLERWGKLIRMPSKDMLTEAAQALDSENVSSSRKPQPISAASAARRSSLGTNCCEKQLRSSGLPSAEARCCSFPKTSPNKAFLIARHTRSCLRQH